MKSSASGTLYIVPDTDALLHFKRPDTIDWRSFGIASKPAFIFVANTLREVEQHKDGMKVGRRDVARDISAWLRRARKGEDTHGCEILISPLEPRNFDDGLDPSSGDDRFVASVRDLRQNGKNAVAYTNDFLCQAKLERFGLPYIEPRQEDARSSARDELDERLRKVEKALSEKPSPALLTAWSSAGALSQKFSIRSPKWPPSLEEEGKQVPEFRLLERNYAGLYETRIIEPDRILGHRPHDNLVRTSPQIAEKFNRDRLVYLESYARFLAGEIERLNRKSRVMNARFSVLNEGSAPATNVRLQIMLSSGAIFPGVTPPWGAQSEMPSPPNFPLGGSYARIRPPLSPDPFYGYAFHDHSPLVLKRIRGDLAEARREALQHGDIWTTSEIPILLEADFVNKEVLIESRVWADQLPEAAIGVLKVELSAS